MRRARILGAQKREKSITPAILRLAWNELAGRPAADDARQGRPPASTTSPPGGCR
jgi:hypothetical protein